MKRLVLAAVILLPLCGCEGGSASPAPVQAPPPPQMPGPVLDRPPRRVFVADWSGPDLKAALSINGDVPPIDTIPAGSDAIWGVFNDPTSAPLLTQPGPNAIYAADGALTLDADGIGYALISRATFSRDGVISSQAEITLLATYKNPWGGLVGQYNGDAKPDTGMPIEEAMWKTGEWRGIYFSVRDGKLVLAYWGPGTDRNACIEAKLGVPYVVRSDYDHSKGGAWTHYIFDKATGACLYKVVEDPANPQTDDTMLLGQDPHFAFFLGDMKLRVGPADVCVA